MQLLRASAGYSVPRRSEQPVPGTDQVIAIDAIVHALESTLSVRFIAIELVDDLDAAPVVLFQGDCSARDPAPASDHPVWLDATTEPGFGDRGCVPREDVRLAFGDASLGWITVAIGFETDENRKPTTAAAALQPMIPMLDAYFRIILRQRRADDARRGLAAALDAVDFGIVTVNREGHRRSDADRSRNGADVAPTVSRTHPGR